MPESVTAAPACSGGVLNTVADAGVKGDGQADDTASVQKAITTAYSSGRCLYLPGGVYRWSKPASILGDPAVPAILRSTAGATSLALSKPNGRSGSDWSTGSSPN